MAKKKDDNSILIIILLLIGGYFLYPMLTGGSATAPVSNSSTSVIGSSGGSSSGSGQSTPPPTSTPNSSTPSVPSVIVPSMPSFSFPTFTWPSFDWNFPSSLPSGQEPTDSSSTIDPCITNPNMIGCGVIVPTPVVNSTTNVTPIIDYARPMSCSGYNYGMPSQVLYTAMGTKYTSFSCLTNLDCELNPPGAYTGRPSSLICCSGECWGPSR